MGSRKLVINEDGLINMITMTIRADSVRRRSEMKGLCTRTRGRPVLYRFVVLSIPKSLMAVLCPVILLGLLPIGVVVGLTAIVDHNERKANDEPSLNAFRLSKTLMIINFPVALLCFATVSSRYRLRRRFY